MYERELDWLEGLALYTEMKLYEMVAETESRSNFASYKVDLPYRKTRFKQIRDSLGEHEGHSRFYNSGMAMALILDKIAPNWKESILETELALEDLIRQVVGMR